MKARKHGEFLENESDSELLAVTIKEMSASQKWALYLEMVKLLALAANEELDSQLREDIHTECANVIFLLRSNWGAI